MRLLVTGAAGFIGSNFIKYWVEKYPKTYPIVYDNITYAGNINNLRPLRGGHDYNFVKGDINDYKLLSDILKWEQVDLVVHFAAESHVDNSIADSSPFIQTNINGTHTVLELCKQNKLPLVHISTDEVLAHDLPIQRNIDDCYIGPIFKRKAEDAQYGPTSPYAASKASGEMLALSFAKTYEMPITIVRPTNVYGSNQHPEKLIPKVIKNALANKSIPIYGQGLEWRDWLYVDDLCKALDLIIHTPPGGIWHVARNDERRNIDIVKHILKLLGKPESLIEFVPQRAINDFSYSLDCVKIKKLGWKPEYTFEQGMSKLIEAAIGTLSK